MTDFATRRRMMVDTQVRPSDVTEFPIIDAMLSVPREAFVPTDRIEAAYADELIALGGDAVLLDARCFAKMLEAVDLTNRDLVLDLGAGLGYSAAVIARIAEAVVAVEDDADRVEEAQSLLAEHHADNVALVEGSLAKGAPEHGPYDVIVVECGVTHIPAALVDQLKDGGRIVAIFMDGALGVVKTGVKHGGAVNWRFAFNAGAPVRDDFKTAPTFAL